MLKDKKIILGITGGIAAYKAAFLIRLFKKAGAEVKVVGTANAFEFITRVTLESLSENKVYDEVFGTQNDYTTEHVALTDWGDIFVVAPATANIIGKFANGIADDALSTSLIAFDKKVFLAPAMNCKMYAHFSVQKNLKCLKEQHVEIIEPAKGFLACGYEGKGRMEEPEHIFSIVESFFSKQKTTLQNKRILVTAGPTHEAIDPVRFIGNSSSGKMGYAIANELANRGALVTLISGPVQIQSNHQNIDIKKVSTADEMYGLCMKHFSDCHAAIMTAAVADFKPKTIHKEKIKKEGKGQSMHLELIPTPDILQAMGEKKKNQVLVGFALETMEEEKHALEKLKKKNLDFIVLNSLNDSKAGFGYDTNKVTIIDNKKKVFRYPLKEKSEVAADIVDVLEKFLTK